MVQRFNFLKVMLCLTALLLGGFVTYAQNIVSHNFNNGNLGPFEVCTTKSPNYARVIGNKVETYWTERGFDGGRVSRGTEFCYPDFTSLKETWMGFTMNINRSHRNDTQSGVAQIFQFVDDSNIFTWTGMLKYEYGDLRIVRRSGKNTSSQVDNVVYANYPRGQDMHIIIHYILSAQNKGKIEIWVNGIRRYNANNINFGFGNWRNDVQHDDTYVELKLGQYNYQDNEYKNNEERIIHYDNVTWYNGGSEGYNTVNPSSNTTITPISSNGTIVQIRKRNASGFAFDGGVGGENGQNVYLWSQNANNRNQQWVEIDRGNGFYSYQKQGTNFCIDGNRGGEDGQNAYLWTCSNSNQNQHWKKVSTSGGAFRLEKRNSPSYSLDGNGGGENGQNVYLWASNNNNQNQQWLITPVGSAKSITDVVATNNVIVYPNPVVSRTTIQGAANSTISIYDITGQELLVQEITADSEELDLSALPTGIYYGRVGGEQSIHAIKIVKK